ncbi:MAG: hypothetical protein U9Q74_05300 [Gemmatimonadota bacterium]|nr:hypothetical protein [Gemmatimonadota bacterium]
MLAALLGVSQRQVANLAREGMPHHGELYPVAACVQWYIRRRSAEGKPADERTARARKINAEAEVAELNLLERRAELIPRAVHLARSEQFAQRLFAAITGELPALIRGEFSEYDAITLQEKTERIGDGLIAACRSTGDEIEGPAEEIDTGDPDADQVAAEEDAAWAEHGDVSR